MKIDVAGVLIDNITKSEAIEKIESFVNSGTAHFIVTPYSELLVFAMDNPTYKNVLNSASLSLADGIGVLWAAKYLNTKDSLLKTLFAIIFNRRYINSVIKEQISGSRLAFDLARLAEEKNYSLALVGGEGNVAAQASYELKKLFPSIRINLALSGRSFDSETIKEIADSNSDILLIAYSPPKQERWIYENLQKLNSKAVLGLGGTLDYIAGKRPPAPHFLHQIGLEWLWRLITQPWRIIRIWKAVPVLIWKIYRYKHVRHKS
jgi:N-acetylglucosaminyldiphosphoundecaprenol N-acetyl-beta-D-mannosaminyltransferase